MTRLWYSMAMSEDIKNEIKGLIYGAGYTVAKLAEAMGTSTQNLNQKISRGSLKYSELKEVLAIIGYDVSFTKRVGG